MSQETQAQVVNQQVAQTQPADQTSQFQLNQEQERQRRGREQILVSELENAKREAEQYKQLTDTISKRGWDLNTLMTASPTGESENPQILKMREEMALRDQKLTALETRLIRKEQLSDIKSFLNNHQEQFELVHMYDYAEKVQAMVEDVYAKEKKIVTYAEAAQELEKALEGYERTKAQKISQSKKAKTFYQGVGAAPIPTAQTGAIADKAGDKDAVVSPKKPRHNLGSPVGLTEDMVKPKIKPKALMENDQSMLSKPYGVRPGQAGSQTRLEGEPLSRAEQIARVAAKYSS